LRFALAIIACLLFISGYGISECFYPGETDTYHWHVLRGLAFALTISCAGSAYLFEPDRTEKYFKATMCILIGMLMGDIADKIIALVNNTEDRFSLIDILFIGASLILGIKKYVYAGKDQTSA
jgi:hypothetical protein